MGELLNSIEGPEDLRGFSLPRLRNLAAEIRDLIVEVVSCNGGHLSSNLGVVELTIALHCCFDFLRDRLIWDVGHQAYAHKILTGRGRCFDTLRCKDGISGFADKKESPYDTFAFGHTGSSVSAGLGMACAREMLGGEGKVVVVIGDGAIASGMPFEALNNAGELEKDLLIVLNDNEMSISRSVGAVARYLSKVRSSTPYGDIKRQVSEVLSRWRPVLDRVDSLYGRVSEGVQKAITPGGLFVELGFHYYGPVDGHDVGELIEALRRMKRIEGPVLLHVLTQKGRGFEPARSDPAAFHSSGRFKIEGEKVVQIAELLGGQDGLDSAAPAEQPLTYSEAVGWLLLKFADDEPRLVTITAAMRDGTGLRGFAERYPERFHDVGICEQHAVGFAGGLAAGGLLPVVCIYSTFLQRALDQLFQDIALQEAPVVFCVDRAGLVGSDGPTHHGLYDVSYFRSMPGFVLMAPADGTELEAMLRLALSSSRPCAIRYPRENLPETPCGGAEEFPIGRAEVLRTGGSGAIIAYGAEVCRALEAADILADRDGLDVTVVNARFAKPLDRETIFRVVREHEAVVVAEDHAVTGGIGGAVLEALSSAGIAAGHVRLAGVPDRFVEHATRREQLAQLGLGGPGLAERLRGLVAGRSE